MKTYLLFLLYLMSSWPVLAQETCKRLQFCSHASSDITTDKVRDLLSMPSVTSMLENVNNAQKIVNRLLCLANTPAVYISVRAAACPNAVAVNCGDQKYILFNTDYLQQVMASADSSVIYGVFAHEVGHLIRGDAWLGGERKHEAELNADKFAGHMMGLLNFKKEIAIATLNSVGKDSTVSHPARYKREEKLAAGWLAGQTNRSRIDTNSLRYLMQCKADSASPFTIDCSEPTKSTTRRNFYLVQCRIKGDTAQLATIKNITYYLHPYSFADNSITYAANEVLPIDIWGSFELRASVVCVDGDVSNEYLLHRQILIIDEKTGARRDKSSINSGVYLDDVSSQKRRRIPSAFHLK